ncbi:MAG: DUF2177 family protein [Xanthobacteraceae bacterium]
MLTALMGYVTTLVAFFVTDMVWLGIMAPRYYRPTMGDIALATVNLPAAAAFYVLYPIGLLVFAIYPALKTGSVTTALIQGALFGFFTYATYDLTNLATLRNWTWSLTLIDVAWGTILASASAAIAFLLLTKFVTSS